MVLQCFFAIVMVGHVIRTVTLCTLPYIIMWNHTHYNSPCFVTTPSIIMYMLPTIVPPIIMYFTIYNKPLNPKPLTS